MVFQRKVVEELASALRRGPRLLQILVGPRQVGKTTAAWDLAKGLGWPCVFEAADVSPPPGPEWIETQWQRARSLAGRPALLVLDEIQKVSGWSVTVKRLWDEEQRRPDSLSVVLLGSSSLQLHHGMTESLAGRFLLHRCMHWSFPEVEAAFGMNLDQWIYFGGYPGAQPFVRDEALWVRYIADALIETAIARDVLQMHTVAKPALLRSLFGLAATHPAQILSWNKMLGQLVDAGNTTTLSHYADLLETAFLLSALPLYSAGTPRKRAGSPKLVLWNNALVSAFCGRSFASARRDGPWWGRLVENAVGSHLLNQLPRESFNVAYWRDGTQEVDYVVTRARETWALEVKSGRPGRTSGLQAFRQRYPAAHALVIGSGGIPLDEFFADPPSVWFE
ncbi:MAG: ATP-binding protein [Verrucomicrobiales bacterium]